MRPCIVCGTPAAETRCEEHRAELVQRKGSPRARGYDRVWDKLSKRAREVQPWCSDCYTTQDLTTDHLPRAWRRKAQGKPIRLSDVEVVCRPCNARRGTSRPGSDDEARPATQGRGADDERTGLRAEAKTPLHTGGRP